MNNLIGTIYKDDDGNFSIKCDLGKSFTFVDCMNLMDALSMMIINLGNSFENSDHAIHDLYALLGRYLIINASKIDDGSFITVSGRMQ